MKVECPGCNKVYNFKVDKLPPQAFSFGCKVCADKVQITQAQINAAKTQANKKKAAGPEIAKQKAKRTLPRIRTDTLKKSFMKIGDFVSHLADRSEREWVWRWMNLLMLVTFYMISQRHPNFTQLFRYASDSHVHFIPAILAHSSLREKVFCLRKILTKNTKLFLFDRAP